MPHYAWNKGHTKETHPSIQKTAMTMRLRGVDNFARWREDAKKKGMIRSTYPALIKNGDLAELIGVILGDGHIGQFPRTQSLTVVGTASNRGFIERYARLIETVFDQKPSTKKRTKCNAVDIRIYQKHISDRLNIPSGAKGRLDFSVPRWILANKDFLVRYLRGLYEAEGSLNFHPKTYTHKLLFSNHNQSLIAIVMRSLKKLGFHPHYSSYKVQISRKDEVKEAVRVLCFRDYNK